MASIDFSWLIGGPQGSGVESGANVFSKVCAEVGYQIFGKREEKNIALSYCNILNHGKIVNGVKVTYMW